MASIQIPYSSGNDKDRLLVLIRHGQSEWNLKNLFTGLHDVELTSQGIDQARAAGRKLKELGIGFDVAYTSTLKRAQHTLKLVSKNLKRSRVNSSRLERTI